MVQRERLAIIGSGIAGLGCAYLLDPERHPANYDITLFEASDRLGGHANTVTVTDSSGRRIGVDTGFIVCNDRNYPLLNQLFEELGVALKDSEMSFGVTDRNFRDEGLLFTYRATNLASLLADRRNMVRPELWRMLADIARFYRRARALLAEKTPDHELTLAEFLADAGYSDAFVDLHLIPMGASVWSSDPGSFDRFPAVSLFRFLDNHGLLGVGDRPQWRTVVGGSRSYVDALVARLSATIRTSSPVHAVTRHDDGVEVMLSGGDGRPERFDRVILATHSDQALALLDDATAEEKEILGAIRYQPNRATLHTDTSVLSPVLRAWAAWNYDRPPDGRGRATLTYDLTNLQRLDGDDRYLVTLNSDHRIDPDRILASFDYAHPVFDTAAMQAQARFDEIDGVARTHFCGAYWGYGFHEDGLASAVRVCRKLGSTRWR